jgi:hypothetical protein
MLYSLALDVNLWVQYIRQSEDRTQLFFFPLSQQAYAEFQAMEAILTWIQLNPWIEMYGELFGGWHSYC